MRDEYLIAHQCFEYGLTHCTICIYNSQDANCVCSFPGSSGNILRDVNWATDRTNNVVELNLSSLPENNHFSRINQQLSADHLWERVLEMPKLHIFWKIDKIIPEKLNMLYQLSENKNFAINFVTTVLSRHKNIEYACDSWAQDGIEKKSQINGWVNV